MIVSGSMLVLLWVLLLVMPSWFAKCKLGRIIVDRICGESRSTDRGCGKEGRHGGVDKATDSCRVHFQSANARVNTPSLSSRNRPFGYPEPKSLAYINPASQDEIYSVDPTSPIHTCKTVPDAISSDNIN